MSELDLRLSVVVSCMEQLANDAAVGKLSAIGCTKREWEKTTGRGGWTVADRQVVVGVMESLVYAGMDTAGCARFEAPAEWIAAHIAFFVNSRNRQAMCRWFPESYGANALASDAVEMEPVRPEKLYSLVLRAADEANLAEFASRFESRTKLKLSHAVEAVNE